MCIIQNDKEQMMTSQLEITMVSTKLQQQQQQQLLLVGLRYYYYSNYQLAILQVLHSELIQAQLLQW